MYPILKAYVKCKFKETIGMLRSKSQSSITINFQSSYLVLLYKQ